VYLQHSRPQSKKILASHLVTDGMKYNIVSQQPSEMNHVILLVVGNQSNSENEAAHLQDYKKYWTGR
jgi:hypothetical protein